MVAVDVAPLLSDDGVAVAYALETGLLPLIVPASRAYLQGDTDGPDVNNEEHTRQDWLTAFESVRDREDKPDEWIELQSMLVDVLCMMDIQLRAGKQEESMQRLVEFVQDLLDHKLVDEPLLVERMEPELLVELELAVSVEHFRRRIVKVRSAMLYRQQKFNLLREESEGYAKVITEVQEALAAKSGADNARDFLNLLQSLIGYFDLDPNRVLDKLLDLFSTDNIREHAPFFLAIFELLPFSKTVYASLLGFKFQHYAGKESTVTPQPLFLAAAMLIQHDRVELDALYPHLFPADIAISAAYEKSVVECKQLAKNVGKVALNSTGADLENSAAEKKDTVKKPEIQDNQKARMCSALLAIGEFNLAMVLLKRFPKLCFVESRLVPLFCHHLHFMLEPVYKGLRLESCILRGGAHEVSPFPPDADQRIVTNKTQQCNSYEELATQFFPLLEFVGVRIHQDVHLVVKLCRLARASPDPASDVWMHVLMTYVIPTLSLAPANPMLADEVWQWIGKFPYVKRYTIYGTWQHREYDNVPELLVARATAAKETKKIMRRVSKDNVKQFGRALAKISHKNPVVCFATILDQLQVYENMIVPVVDCFRYLSDLSFDVLSFVMLEDLSNPLRSRLKEDGANLSMWLNCLAVFAGTFFQRYPTIEVTGLLNYVFLQVKDGNPFDLVVIKELVTKMSGVEQLLEGYSEQQLEAMAGGETLRSESMTFATQRNSKRSAQRLIRALLSANLIIDFGILIAKQRASCLFHTEINHLKLLSTLYDQVHETFTHYTEFVASHLDRKLYVELVPSLAKLLLHLKLDPETAWAILRPKLVYQLADAYTSAIAIEDKQSKEAAGMDVDDKMTAVVQPTWEPVLQQYITEASEYLGESSEFLSPEFYVTFWQLTLYDIHIPLERYNAEIEKCKNQVREIEKEDTAGRRTAEKERLRSTIDKLQDELAVQQKHHERIEERLVRESAHWFTSDNRSAIVDAFIQHCIRPRIFFSANDATFCARFILKMHALGTVNFSTITVLNRMFDNIDGTLFMCTQNEAAHYGRFMNELLTVMHRWQKDEATFKVCAYGADESLVGFRKRWSVKKEDGVVIGAVKGEERAGDDTKVNDGKAVESTTKEEHAAAVDLQEEDTAAADAAADSAKVDTPETPDASGKGKISSTKSDEKSSSTEEKLSQLLLPYKEFLSVLYKWHKNLLVANKTCFESKEYMHMRNSIIALDKLADKFPIIDRVGKSLDIVLQTALAGESREDLKVLLNRYNASLQKGKSKWVTETKFLHMPSEPKTESTRSESRGPSAKRTNEDVEEGEDVVESAKPASSSKRLGSSGDDTPLKRPRLEDDRASHGSRERGSSRHERDRETDRRSEPDRERMSSRSDRGERASREKDREREREREKERIKEREREREMDREKERIKEREREKERKEREDAEKQRSRSRDHDSGSSLRLERNSARADISGDKSPPTRAAPGAGLASSVLRSIMGPPQTTSSRGRETTVPARTVDDRTTVTSQPSSTPHWMAVVGDAQVASDTSRSNRREDKESSREKHRDDKESPSSREKHRDDKDSSSSREKRREDREKRREDKESARGDRRDEKDRRDKKSPELKSVSRDEDRRNTNDKKSEERSNDRDRQKRESRSSRDETKASDSRKSSDKDDKKQHEKKQPDKDDKLKQQPDKVVKKELDKDDKKQLDKADKKQPDNDVKKDTASRPSETTRRSEDAPQRGGSIGSVHTPPFEPRRSEGRRDERPLPNVVPAPPVAPVARAQKHWDYTPEPATRVNTSLPPTATRRHQEGPSYRDEVVPPPTRRYDEVVPPRHDEAPYSSIRRSSGAAPPHISSRDEVPLQRVNRSGGTGNPSWPSNLKDDRTPQRSMAHDFGRRVEMLPPSVSQVPPGSRQPMPAPLWPSQAQVPLAERGRASAHGSASTLPMDTDSRHGSASSYNSGRTNDRRNTRRRN